jgi:glycosyltransferase involved in cell wall biosynthesis
MPGRPSICLYTPSADPSGMGAHMLDLVAEYVAVAEISVLMRPTEAGRRLLDAAAELGARTLALPSPRDPGFAPAVTGFLADHPADVFHCHVGIGAEDWDGVRLARGAGCPAVVQTQHQPYLLSHPRKREQWHHAAEPVDRLIAVSEALRRTYERIGAAPERFTTVPNGVAPRTDLLGRARARDRLGLGSDQPVVLTIGRLAPMKGHRYLIEAVPAVAARFPQLTVVILGEGNLRGALTRQAADLGVADRVCLAGHRTDARLLLDAADVFVLPSLHEGMPLVALEAMEAGLPVVATDVIGTAEVVVPGRTGVLVRPGDAPALAEAIGALLADPDRRCRLGQAGRCRYLRSFTRQRMAADVWAVYEQVLRTAGAVRVESRL